MVGLSSKNVVIGDVLGRVIFVWKKGFVGGPLSDIFRVWEVNNRFFKYVGVSQDGSNGVRRIFKDSIWDEG